MRGEVKRQYGHRGHGKMSDNRFMWLRNLFGQFVAMRYEKTADQKMADELGDEFTDPELGPSYILILPRPMGGRPIRFNITSLTKEELDLTRQFFTTIFDLAEPVVIHRDKVAQHAADQGDDSYARIYRQVPQFVERKGALREDDEGILQRSWDSFVGAGSDGAADGRVRGDGDELAPGEPEKDRAQDDGSTPDES